MADPLHTELPRAWWDRAVDWLRERERAVLAVGIGFQVVVLLAMIGLKAFTLLTGETVLVQVMPLDPRDLFRGDYVILSYAFSRLPDGGLRGLPADERGRNGQAAYVRLNRDTNGRHWRAGQFSLDRPATGALLRGRLVGYHQIEYGIESYFVPEGQGRPYEQAVQQRKLWAQLAVDRHGKAVVKRLVIE
jgi:uncharacterized membrane-anchored protein